MLSLEPHTEARLINNTILCALWREKGVNGPTWNDIQVVHECDMPFVYALRISKAVVEKILHFSSCREVPSPMLHSGLRTSMPQRTMRGFNIHSWFEVIQYIQLNGTFWVM